MVRKLIRILILENNLIVLSKIIEKLSVLEQNQQLDFSLVILTDYDKVKKYINKNPNEKFDIILLDRDCNLKGSFHVLDIEKFGADKVIAISATERFNKQAMERGVTKVVEKDLLDLDTFAQKLMREILIMLDMGPLLKEYNL